MKNTLKVLLLGIALMTMSCQANAQIHQNYAVIFDEDSVKGDFIQPEVIPQGDGIDGLNFVLPGIFQLYYPKEARNKGLSGSVIYTYVVNKKGVKSDWKLFKGIGAGCDEMVFNYILRNSPDTISPAMYHGEPVDVLCMFAVHCGTENIFNEVIAKDFDMKKWVEQEAVRIGVSNDGLKSIDRVEDMTFERMVPYVSFTVKKKSGKIKNVDIAKSSGFPILDSEAVRAMESISKWPERASDEDANYILPVKFDPNK